MKEQKEIKNIKPIEIEIKKVEDENIESLLNKFTDGELFAVDKKFKDQLFKIQRNLQSSVYNVIQIGKIINSIIEDETYLFYGYKNVYDLMEYYFNFSPTTTKNHIAIAKKFDGKDEILKKGYSLSQLVEMSSMDNYDQITPAMTIKEIRNFKNSEQLSKRLESYKNNKKDFLENYILKLLNKKLGESFVEYKSNPSIYNDSLVFDYIYDKLKIEITYYFETMKYSFWSRGLVHDFVSSLTEEELITRINEFFIDLKDAVKEEKEKKKELKGQKESALNDLKKNDEQDSFLILKNDEERKAYINNFSNWKQIVTVPSIGYIFYEFKRENFPYGIVWNMRDGRDEGNYYFVPRNKEDAIKQLIINVRVPESELITFIRDYKTNYGKE